MRFYAQSKSAFSAIAALYILLGATASRHSIRDNGPIISAVKEFFSSPRKFFTARRHNASATVPEAQTPLDMTCTTEVEIPAKLVAVDGGGTQVKVLLLPNDWNENRPIRSIAELSQCGTTEEVLKELLLRKDLWLPTYDATPFIPVTGGLGDRLSEEKAFTNIVKTVKEFDAIAAGTIAEQRNRGFVAYKPADSTFPLKGINRSSEPGILRAIYVDTTHDMIYHVAWDGKGNLLGDPAQLTHLEMGAEMFKRSFYQLYKRYSGANSTGKKEEQIYKKAAALVKTRLMWNEKERIALENLDGNDGVRADIQRIYRAQAELVSKAHKLIKEIYPNGIGKLGPYAAACFMAHASRCHPDLDGLMHYAMGFIEMLVVNTIQLADLWKGIVGVEKVVFVGKMVNSDHKYGQIARQFFEFRKSKEIAAKTVVLDDLMSSGSSETLMKKLRGQILQRRSNLSPRQSAPYAEVSHNVLEAVDSFTIASLGTGVPIIKVESGKYTNPIGGSAIGGGTFWGLMKAAFPRSPEFLKVVEAAVTGAILADRSNENALVGAVAQRTDVAVASNIAEVVSLATQSQGTKFDTAVFVGGFLKGNPRAEGVIAHVCASFGIKSMFEFEGTFTTRKTPQGSTRLRGFIGAFGAWLLSRPKDDAQISFTAMPDAIDE